MIVLDTTVLIYAVGADHPSREPCQQLIRAIAGGTLLSTTTIEVIQEFLHVRARRRDRERCCRARPGLHRLLSPLLIVEETDLREGLRLFEEGAGFGSFDAALAAAAHAAGAEALVSADTGFSGIATIHHVVPDADGVRRLLAAAEE